jgi:MoaA/NifB/PqqE/SkfB family radical SAM enzyme
MGQAICLPSYALRLALPHATIDVPGGVAVLSLEKRSNIRSFHREIHSPCKDGTTSNAPLLMAIETTTRCNFQCVHCCHSVSHPVPADISLDLFQSVVSSIRAAFEFYLFGDGEVLLDVPRHLAMIARVYQEDPACALGFSTNGKLLTPEVYELYASAGIAYIQVSVDAASQSLYDSMRRGGSFQQLQANLEGILDRRRRARSRQPQLHLATVISKQNFRELPLIAEFARKYGFTYWYINAEYPHNPGRERLRLDSHDVVELECIWEEIAKKYKADFAALLDSSTGLLSDTVEKWRQPDRVPVYCTVPWQHFELKANGDVKLCPYFHEPVASMDGKSLMDVWNGKEYRQIRQAFAARSNLPRFCVDCKFEMRRQYLPGYPGLPHEGILARVGQAVKACVL